MRQRVGVDRLVRDGLGVRAGRRFDDQWLVEVRRVRRDRGELPRELTERQVLASPIDQTERRRIPEGRRAAVADQDLEPVGKRQELGETSAYPADDVPDATPAMAGAEVAAGGVGQPCDGLRPHLRRP